jgi:hypothetical protein
MEITTNFVTEHKKMVEGHFRRPCARITVEPFEIGFQKVQLRAKRH